MDICKFSLFVLATLPAFFALFAFFRSFDLIAGVKQWWCGIIFFFVCSCLLSVLSAMWSRVNRMHRTVTSATFSSMYFFIKWSYLIRNLISNVRMSHSITDVSSDPVSRYCELFGTSKHVTAPVWPAGRVENTNTHKFIIKLFHDV